MHLDKDVNNPTNVFITKSSCQFFD